MSQLKKLIYIGLGGLITLTFVIGIQTYAAPLFNYSRSILPEANNTYDLGSSTPATWKTLFVNTVLVGTTTPTTSKLFVQATGTSTPLTVTSSTGSSLLTVLSNGHTWATGHVSVGENAPQANNLLRLVDTITNDVGESALYGIYMAPAFKPTNASTSINGLYSSVSIPGDSTQYTDTLNGMFVGANFSAPVQLDHYNTLDLGHVQNSGSGAMATGTGLTIESGLNYGGGSIGELIGLNIQDQTVGGINYAIKTGAGKVSFGGNVGINTTTPNTALAVVGSISSTALNNGGCVQAGAGGLLTTVGACGTGGSGNTTFLIGSGTIYNATTTDLVGIGTITPATTLYVLGKAGTNPFTVASSTSAELLSVLSNGQIGINSSTPIAGLSVVGARGFNPLSIASSTNTQLFTVTQAGNLGIGTTTPTQDLVIKAKNTTLNGIALIADNSGLPTVSINEILNFGARSGIINLYETSTQAVKIAAGAAVSSYIANAGNFGIGTVTPTTTLYVQGKGGVNPLQISSSTSDSLLNVSQAGVLTVNNLSNGILQSTSGVVSASSLSQSAGTTLINGVTPIINGGGIWISDIVQSSGANFIIQSPTSTAALGNAVFGGGVQALNSTTYLSNTQFCTGGLFNVSSSTAFTVYLPPLTQIGYGTSPSNCTTNMWAGDWSPQFITNTGSADVTVSASGSGETLLFAPGTGAGLGSGHSWFQVGQFTATSTILGATTTGMSLNTYYADFQPRATRPVIQGQILAASTTTAGLNPEWVVTNFAAGQNISVSTSTPGIISLGVTGVLPVVNGGTATTALGSLTLTSSNLSFGAGDGVKVLIGTTTNITLTSNPTFTNATFTAVTSLATTSLVGNLTVSSLTNGGCVQAGAGGLLTTVGACGTAGGSVTGSGVIGNLAIWTGTSVLATSTLMDNGTVAGINATSSTINFNIQQSGALDPFRIASSSSPNYFVVKSNGLIGIGSSTPMGLLSITGTTSLPTLDLFVIASSSNARTLTVTANGRVGINSSTPVALFVAQGASTSPTTDIFQTSSSTGALYLNVTSKGGVGINTGTPISSFAIKGVAGTMPMSISSSTNTVLFEVNQDQTVGIGSSTPTATLVIQGYGAYATTDILRVASSTNLSVLNVTANGRVGVGSTTPTATMVVQGTAGQSQNLFTAASSTGSAVLTVSGATPTAGIFTVASATGITVFTVNIDNTVMIGTTTLGIANLGAVGTTSQPTMDLFALASSTGSDFFRVKANGTIFATGTASSGSSQTGYWCYDGSSQLIRDSAVCLVSALKFKKDIKPLDVGLKELMEIPFVSFYKIDPLDEKDSHRQMGVIADWVAKNPKLAEMLVTYDSNGDVHGFRYEQFTALLGKAVQEQQGEIEKLKVQKGIKFNPLNLIGLIGLLGFIPAIRRKRV